MSHTFMDRLRVFLGISREPPRNDFRNPIWGSDDDDDDGDELYSRHSDIVHNDPLELHADITRQMHDMFRSMSSIFGDIKMFFNEDFTHDFASGFPALTDIPPDSEEFNSNNIRNYYLKPGYQKQPLDRDIDLDGKVSSSEISGLLKQKTEDKKHNIPTTPFDGRLVPGTSYCKTVITTSVKKPDGSVETKRIVKNGNDVVEETTTTSVPDPRAPASTNMDQTTSFSQANIFFSDLSSLFKTFY